MSQRATIFLKTEVAQLLLKIISLVFLEKLFIFIVHPAFSPPIHTAPRLLALTEEEEKKRSKEPRSWTAPEWSGQTSVADVFDLHTPPADVPARRSGTDGPDCTKLPYASCRCRGRGRGRRRLRSTGTKTKPAGSSVAVPALTVRVRLPLPGWSPPPAADYRGPSFFIRI